MLYQINSSNWLSVEKPETRAKLASLFNIARKGGSVVHGTRVVSDGYRNQELAGITIEKINVLLDTQYVAHDILKGFNEVVEALEKGITLPINSNQNDVRSEDESQQNEGTVSGGNEGNPSDEENNGELGDNIPSSTPETVSKSTRGRKPRAKNAADTADSNTK